MLLETVGNGNFLSDFLSFIKDRMLQAQRLHRADCKEVYKFLLGAHEKCENEKDGAYCTPDLLPDVEKDPDLIKFENEQPPQHGFSDSGSVSTLDLPSIKVTDAI
jgi:hypothetical protein